MQKEITLEMITPRGTILQQTVSYVQLPTKLGLIGILADHAPLISALDIGVVTYRPVGAAEKKAAISGGFLEVRDNKVVVLAPTAELADHIDLERAKAAYERAQQRLKNPTQDIDVDRARAAMFRALSRMRAKNTVR